MKTSSSRKLGRPTETLIKLILAFATAGFLNSLTGCFYMSNGSGSFSKSVNILNEAAQPSSGLSPSSVEIGDLSGEQATAADTLVDSIGVNTHFSYTNTYYYSQWPTISQFLISSGIRHIRDGVGPMSTDFYGKVNGLYATAGIKVMGGLSTGTDSSSIPSALAAGVQNLAGNLEGIESLNEYDVSGDANWVSTLTNYQMALYQAVKENPATKNLPVIGPSMAATGDNQSLGNLSAYLDFGNLHNYFGNNYPGSSGWGGTFLGFSYGCEGYSLVFEAIAAGTKPVWTTETGYTLGQSTNLPDNMVAKYLPRLILEQLQVGIQRTYIYQLAAEGSTEAAGEGSGGYGLIDFNLNPRPVYYAVQNLISTLSDRGASFPAGKLEYVINGASSTVHHSLFQKRSGTFFLIVWVEAEGMNPTTLQAEPVASQNITIQLTTAPKNVSTIVFADDGTISSYEMADRPQTIPLTITDNLTVVEIGR